MRFTAEQYDAAIENLKLAKQQLEPDRNCCSVCGDSGHMAWECGFNPLAAVAMCVEVSKTAETFHDQMHWLSGWYSAFGVQLGPRRMVLDEEKLS